MNRSRIALAASLVTLVTAACTQDGGPTNALPSDAVMAVTGSSCSISAINRQARDYFASRTDVVYTSIDALQNALRTSDGADDNTAGFAILDRIGAAADLGTTAVKGTATQGSTVANSVLACMNGQGYNATTGISFAAALGANGLFDVVYPGTSATPAHVVSRGAFAVKYGAEPSTGGWPVAGPTLFYGYELGATFAATYGESAIGTPFELSTLPSGLTFAPALAVGECDVSNTSARLLHDGSSSPANILPPRESLGFCVALGPSLDMAPSAGVIAMEAEDLPTEPVLSARGGGALLSGLSPSGLVTFTPTITFVQQPVNTPLGAVDQFPNDVKVLVTSASGKPLVNAYVQLLVAGNNGSYELSGNVEQTDASGIATFSRLRISKTGGYTLSANAFGGTKLSAFFNITGN